MTMSLTYPERVLKDGLLQDGLLTGIRSDVCGSREAKHLTLARKAYARYRRHFGYSGTATMLTKPDAQAKLGKSERYALGLMLVPANGFDWQTYAPSLRPINVCPLASIGCRAACLSTSGHGAFAATQRARQVRTGFLFTDPFAAGVLIGSEILKARQKMGPDAVTFRFNVVSDVRIELIAPEFLRALQAMQVRAYDYTAYHPADRDPIHGYDLTYSAKESAHTSDAYLADVLRSNGRVAMPFMVKPGNLPTRYSLAGQEFEIIDGDSSDDRTEDPHGVIVGLSAKGNAGKADQTGFIRSLQDA